MERFNLAAVKAKTFPKVQWSDLLTITGGDMPAEDAAKLDEYFSHFTRLDGNKCPGCDESLTGDMMQQLIGSATFTWGLAHGEGHCRRCGYPARGYHYDIGPIRFLPFVLPYHPDELIPRDAGVVRDAERAVTTAASAAQK